jgi:hypothetical protein
MAASSARLGSPNAIHSRSCSLEDSHAMIVAGTS